MIFSKLPILTALAASFISTASAACSLQQRMTAPPTDKYLWANHGGSFPDACLNAADWPLNEYNTDQVTRRFTEEVITHIRKNPRDTHFNICMYGSDWNSWGVKMAIDLSNDWDFTYVNELQTVVIASTFLKWRKAAGSPQEIYGQIYRNGDDSYVGTMHFQGIDSMSAHANRFHEIDPSTCFKNVF